MAPTPSAGCVRGSSWSGLWFRLIAMGTPVVIGSACVRRPTLISAKEIVDLANASHSFHLIGETMKNRTSRAVAALAVTALSTISAQAQIVPSAATPADLVNTLIGPSISVSNVTFTGAAAASGTFTGGTGIIGFESGIILSSGSAADVPGPNVADNTTTGFGQPGDADLNAIVPGTNDAVVLEFDFECKTLQEISFQYVFASEEYNEYVNTAFNDVFAFFVDGTNVALLPDNVTPVSINNVNGGGPIFGNSPSNPAFYINNDLNDGGGAINTEMDGLTVVLNVYVTGLTPGTHHIKLAIADVGDSSWDSCVFIKAESFSCAPPTSACCLVNGSCTEVSEADCLAQGGVFHAGQTCGDVVCPQPSQCVYSQGYWKTHSSEWPVTSLTLGNVPYNQAQLLSILYARTKGNGLVSLATQLIAAKLNQANGALVPASVQSSIDAADALIGNLVVPPVGTGWLAPSATSSLTAALEAYNIGLAPGGPPHCD